MSWGGNGHCQLRGIGFPLEGGQNVLKLDGDDEQNKQKTVNSTL